MRMSDLTQRALTDMVFALFAKAWQLRLVPDEDHTDQRVVSPLYTRGKLIGSTKYLRHKNANGYHIYGRPEAARHVLVDDLCEDAVDALIADGLCPAVVIRTNPNYSWWPSDLSEASGVGRVDGGFSRWIFRAVGG